MKLIFALGNPEPKYDDTRHNVGFWLADHFAAKHNVDWIEKTKFKATVAELGIGDEKIIVAKPTTYYNEVGQSMRALTDFYKFAPADTVSCVLTVAPTPVTMNLARARTALD